jgi:hypothetical protein
MERDMAATPQPAAEAGGLTNEFKKKAGSFFRHAFSFAMIGMMATMVLSPVAMAAAPGAATLGDMGVALVDHYWMMFSAPFTEFDTLADIANNAWNGNFAAGSYELGAHAHGAHGAMGHTTATSCAPFAEWSAGLDSQSLEAMNAKAGINGLTLEQQYTQDFCQ